MDTRKVSIGEYHSNQIGISIKENTVALKGKSGYYIPVQEEGRRLRHAISPLIMRLRKWIQFVRSGACHLTYCEAFDKVMNHQPLADIYLSPERINFLRLKDNPNIIRSVRDIEDRYYAPTQV